MACKRLAVKEIAKIKRPNTLKDILYENIKEFLISGEIMPGSIYSANHFAEVLGVSRTPAREALLQLANEGILEAVQGRGFKVRNFSEKEIRDFFETRKIIELYALEKMAIVLDEKIFRQLDDILKEMKELGDQENIADFIERDKEFHMEIIRHYGNLFLVSISENIRSLISIFGQRAVSYKGRFQEVVQEHRLILQALQNRDKAGALRALHEHLENTEEHLIAKAALG